ncbi:hypothetical protein CFP56_027907 [Quercus suber]|uniref:Uncharacterized protein n=1 Tax=Quercus suber TaxID=58331 RepID=A0AAW0JX65_QUESU
MLTQMWSYWV